MTLSRKKSHNSLSITLYLLMIVLIALLTLSISCANFKNWTIEFSFLIITQFILQCILLRRVSFKMFSFSGMFLVLSYLFHFGQLLTMVFFPSYHFKILNFYMIYDFDGMKLASEFSLFCLLMVGFGYLISINKPRKAVTPLDETILLRCRKAGWLIVILTFPIQIYHDLKAMRISVSAGYLATYNTGSSGVWSALGFVSFTGFVLLMLGYKKQKRKSLLVFLGVTAYLVLTMMAGQRGHQITVIFLFVYIFHKTIYRFKARIMYFVMLVSYFGIALLDTFQAYRGVRGKTLGAFWSMFPMNLGGNPLKGFIAELGATIQTVYLTIQQVPQSTPHAYGGTYLAGLFSILPNVNNIFGSIDDYAQYVTHLQGFALGGSFIGELFYNFSYFGILVSILIGVFVNKISQMVDVRLIRNDYFGVAYLAPLLMYILWWTRDSFSSMLRPFFLGRAFVAHSF